MGKMTDNEVDALQAEVKRLTEQLGLSELKRTEAEQNAIAMAQAEMFTSTATEKPTGRTVKVKMCANPEVKTEKEQKWTEIELPTYFYTINLPAGAGLSLTTNGVAYFHGQTYEFGPRSLADIKSRVARCWDHEKSIHGSDENIFRKQNGAQVGSAAAAQLLARAASLGIQ